MAVKEVNILFLKVQRWKSINCPLKGTKRRRGPEELTLNCLETYLIHDTNFYLVQGLVDAKEEVMKDLLDCQGAPADLGVYYTR